MGVCGSRFGPAAIHLRLGVLVRMPLLLRTQRKGHAPFYVAANPGDPGRRRLLLISYHFPPGRTAGALRWQKFAPLLYERGWSLDVITAAPGILPAVEPSRLAELPPGTAVWGVKQPDLWVDQVDSWLAGAYRAGRRLFRHHPPKTPAPTIEGAALTIQPTSIAPEKIYWRLRDAQSTKRAYNAWLAVMRDRGWALEAETLGRHVISRSQPRHAAVITCGPPHMVHEAGRRLSVAAGVPFVMDLRDPWGVRRRLPADYASPLAFAVADHYERRAVSRASLVVANTEAVRAAMSDRYPHSGAEFLTVMNGFDEEILPPSTQDRFVVAYAGGIYLDRDPRTLFKAAARVITELGLSPAQFGLAFIGNVDDYGGVPIQRMGQEEGIEAFLTTGPPRPRADALKLMSDATMLVSLPQDSPWAIPSKIFEYMNFHAWILALAEAGGPVGALLRDTPADVVPPSDVNGLTRVLKTRYLQHVAGVTPPRLACNAHFSRRAQAQLLLNALDRHVLADESVASRSDTFGAAVV